MRTIFNQRQINDPGLGTAIGNGENRVVDKDGKFRIVRRGAGVSYRDLFHVFINMSWRKFFAIVVLSYVAANVLFACVYLLAGIDNISGAKGDSPLDHFLHAFFFSAQTITTVGYGAMAPGNHLVSTIAAVESMVGLLGFAVATGILYGRFSKPQARIIFSEKAVVAPFQEFKAFMIRIVNARKNDMMEMKATLLYTQMENVNGEMKRIYRPLKLERDSIYLFPLPWTIVHPIDEESPFFGRTPEQLREAQFEVIAMVQGFDDTFSQTVHARSSYRWDEIAFNARFRPMHSTGEDGIVELRVDEVGAIERLQDKPHAVLSGEKNSQAMSGNK